MKAPIVSLTRPLLQRTAVLVAATLSLFSSAWADEEPMEDSLQSPKGIVEPLGIPDPESSLAHYQDDIPPVAPGAYTAPSPSVPTLLKDNWLAISASGLYIFNTGGDLSGHTGWGGVIDASAVLFDRSNGLYAKVGMDFVYFQTDADKERGGIRYDEDIQSYKVHFNAGAGYRFYGFDVYGWAGLGFGATRSDGTPYNMDRSHTSGDFLLQVGARISYHPTDWCSVFAGYRMMWNVPFEGGSSCYYYDDSNEWWSGGYRCHDDCVSGCQHDSRCNCPDEDKRDYPSVLAHAFEVGITFYF